jgi:aspartate/glutamate racemase
MILKGGPNCYGAEIGILVLESYYYKVPGHIKNHHTFDFPVVYKVLEGATPDIVVRDKCANLLPKFIEGAKELEAMGVKAITGSCGFMALLQNKIAAEVTVPVYVSSIMQIPLISQMIGGRKLGILVADKKSFTPDYLEIVNAKNIPHCVAGMIQHEEFRSVIIDRTRSDLNIDLLREKVLFEVGKLYEENPDIGALLIECTDLPPFARDIQKLINKPVFDILTLTQMVHAAIIRKEYPLDC